MGSPHFSSMPDSTDWEDCSTATAVSDPLLSHHGIEQLIWRELQDAPGVRFFNLTVRRVPAGVCIQGVMQAEFEEIEFDVCDFVRQVAPVDNVVNQLLIRDPKRPSRVPR